MPSTAPKASIVPAPKRGHAQDEIADRIREGLEAATTDPSFDDEGFAEALVEEFFEAMDANEDGKVALEEYRDGAMQNQDIIQGLKLFEQCAAAPPPSSMLASSISAPASSK